MTLEEKGTRTAVCMSSSGRSSWAMSAGRAGRRASPAPVLEHRALQTAGISPSGRAARSW